jgi:hypothetical protein
VWDKSFSFLTTTNLLAEKNHLTSVSVFSLAKWTSDGKSLGAMPCLLHHHFVIIGLIQSIGF